MSSEYMEDDVVDDLLEGEDEEQEEDQNDEVDQAELNLEPAEIYHFTPTDFGEEMQMEGQDSDDEDEKRKTAEKRQMEKTAQEHRDNVLKLVETPPGIVLFGGKDPKKVDGFHFFQLDTLSLEADFGYDRRPKLKGHGFTDEKLDEIFSNRLLFVRHLMPEAQSVFVCEQKDFHAIMNFLFFSISVCTDTKLNSVMTKAFFDLRKNYGFKWYLTLDVVICVLLNYGANSKAVANEKFYTKHLKGYLRTVRDSDKRSTYKIPLPDFFVKLQSATEKPDSSKAKFSPLSEEDFLSCVSRMVTLLSEFSSGFPHHTKFRSKGYAGEECIYLYLMCLVGTDYRFINSFHVCEAVTGLIYYHLDNMPANVWFGDKDLADKVKGNHNFCKKNFGRTFALLLNEFYPGELCPEVINWTPLKVSSKESCFTMDHGLNMLHRLELLPHSHRGNILRKQLAFLNLHSLLQSGSISMPFCASIVDAAKIPCLDIKCNETVYLKLLIKTEAEGRNFICLMVIIKLLDILVGYEVDINNTEVIDAIKFLLVHTIGYIKRKIPNMLDVVNFKSVSIPIANLHNVISLCEQRWKLFT